MSRIEVRRVPWHWQHPTNEVGSALPRGYLFRETLAHWDEEVRYWGLGFMRDRADTSARVYVRRPPGVDDAVLEKVLGPRPDEMSFMPQWPQSDCTHLQLYDGNTNCPLSVPLPDLDQLSDWLEEHGVKGDDGDRHDALYWRRMLYLLDRQTRARLALIER